MLFCTWVLLQLVGNENVEFGAIICIGISLFAEPKVVVSEILFK
ncbi:hypothetical protein CSC17_1850 [Klebsiella oxytoca]|nr:hypothetical protein CSC17_1850 [Klebsiella oxytoca]